MSSKIVDMEAIRRAMCTATSARFRYKSKHVSSHPAGSMSFIHSFIHSEIGRLIGADVQKIKISGAF